VVSRRRLRALVVDEDDGVLAFAAEALHSFRPGFEVATARNPRQAREWLGSMEPDLLLTDPTRMDEILRDPRLRNCKIMGLSKPLRLQSLLSAVRKAVDS
jgi:DNA-binding NtrC family response regulator